jgi:uncharacterized protein (DUF2344 family)
MDSGKKAKIYKVRVRYGARAGVTHKDALALFRKAVSASGLPVRPAKINPAWPHAAFGPALEEGYASGAQYADLYFDVKQSPAGALAALQKQNGADIFFLEAKAAPYVFPSVESLCAAAEYSLEFKDARDAVSFAALAESKKIEFNVLHANGMTQTVNLKKYVVSAERVGDKKLKTVLLAGGTDINILETILAKCLGITSENPRAEVLKKVNIIKEKLYWQDSLGGLLPL